MVPARGIAPANLAELCRRNEHFGILFADEICDQVNSARPQQQQAGYTETINE